jgi:hypothetical protein
MNVERGTMAQYTSPMVLECSKMLSIHCQSRWGTAHRARTRNARRC